MENSINFLNKIFETLSKTNRLSEVYGKFDELISFGSSFWDRYNLSYGLTIEWRKVFRGRAETFIILQSDPVSLKLKLF